MDVGPDWSGLAAWGDASLGDTFPTGSMNEVRAANVSGQPVVARLGKRSTEDLDWEIDLLAFLHDAGLAVPRLVPTLDGRLRVGSLIVMAAIEGRPAAGADDYALVARYLSQLHSLTAERAVQRPGWHTCRELVRQERSGPVELRVLPEDVLERCRRAWARLDGLPLSVVHGDPNPSNVRIAPDGQVVLLDWDEARVDASCLDLARPPMPQPLSGMDKETFELARHAFCAWEAAMFWASAPDHARKQLARIP